ncbi:MAG: hypothetical protein GDA43_03060 [Hormoscilla sp. SP5CHS1]|nr:hypothetical protein [Hormoscilla sp. SP12CHS1]MBC6452293.1 hypothetical protein [Hormoscilla sp. SP5CHS1]
MELTLMVSEDVVSRNGKRLIPGGSQISGELVPALDGIQFVSQEIVTPRGRRLNIDASSQIVTETETVNRGVDADSVIEGALNGPRTARKIGGAAAAIIAEITGKIDVEEPIIGAVLGGIAGALLGNNKVNLITINSETDLALKLNCDIAIDRSRSRCARSGGPNTRSADGPKNRL